MADKPGGNDPERNAACNQSNDRMMMRIHHGTEVGI